MSKFFGLFQSNKKVEPQKKSTGKQAFSSPLCKIGDGDLTKPFINSQYVGDKTYVWFGADNLFPQLIDQMYYQSPIHASIIDFQVNTAVKGGYTLESPRDKSGAEEVKERVALKKMRLNKILRGIALDLKMHKRCHFLVETNDDGEIIKFTRLLPATIRYNRSKTLFWYSEDWMKGTGECIPRYEARKANQRAIFSYEDIHSSPGQDVYPLDKTISVFNWCYLDGQSSTLQKDNIQKSIFGTIIISVPKEFETEEAIRAFKAGIEQKEGEVTSALVLSADGKENLPIVSTFPANQNDKAFENMDKRIDDKICQAHSINPIIMGIERPGALGNGSDIKAAYPIWESNVLIPFREVIEEVVGELLELFGVHSDFKLNAYSLLTETLNEQ